MARFNKYVLEEALPLGQKRYYGTPLVKIFSDVDVQSLQDDINAWLLALGTLNGDDILYTLLDFDYPSAFLANNVVVYSVLIRYTCWQPE
jgi:hypothetical protein